MRMRVPQRRGQRCVSFRILQRARSPILIRNREFAISVCDGRRNSQRSDFGAEIDLLKINLVLNREIVTMILGISCVINID